MNSKTIRRIAPFIIAALLLSLSACAGPKAAPQAETQTAEINTQAETQTKAEAPPAPAENEAPTGEKVAEEQPQVTDKTPA